MAIAPQDMADRLIASAPDWAWVRALTTDLDRQLRAAPLERFLNLWDLSASDAARAFGVSRQALSKWRREGIPAERALALADLAAATDLLERRIKRERIPAVVRRRAAALNGLSLYELACDGRHDEVRRAVERMFDLRRIKP